MNRRRFLQLTIALAVAAPTARLAQWYPDPALPKPPPPPAWIPSQIEVDEWLQYYKLTVTYNARKFSDIVAGFFDQDGDTFPKIAETLEEKQLYDEAERAWRLLELDRCAVGSSMGDGYFAGRNGLPRENAQLTGPSNQALAWYNGWNLGNNERLGKVTPA